MTINTERLMEDIQVTPEGAREKIDAITWDDRKSAENLIVGRFISEIGKIVRTLELMNSLYSSRPEYRMSIILANSRSKTSKSNQ